MPQLDARRTYSDGAVLFASDLDAIIDDIETLLNSTKLNDDNLQDAGITASSKLVDGTVTAGKIGTSAVTTAKINDSAVTTAKIADSNVTTAKIADSNVTTAKIADSNVTTAKIADSNVTTAKIADSNVTTAKINDLAVTTAKISTGAVTYAKRGNLNYAIQTPSSGTATVTSASFTQFNNMNVSITTNGKPVLLFISTSADSSGHRVYCTGAGGDVRWTRGGSSIARFTVTNTDSMPISFMFLDAPAAGTYTYALEGLTNGIDSLKIDYAYINAIELG